MIELKIEPYCDNCPEFEAEQVGYKTENGSHTFVTCSHRVRCIQMYEHIKKSNPNSYIYESM